MKHLKTFEVTTKHTKTTQPQIGDIVKCINSKDTYLIKNKCYTVSLISLFDPNTYYQLKEKTRPPNAKYYKERFTIPTPEEIEKYNFEFNINKFNL